MIMSVLQVMVRPDNVCALSGQHKHKNSSLLDTLSATAYKILPVFDTESMKSREGKGDGSGKLGSS